MGYKTVRLIKEVKIGRFEPTKTTFIIRAQDKSYFNNYWSYVTSFDNEEQATEYFDKFVSNKGDELHTKVLKEVKL